MSQRERELVLGYLLGALDDSEMEEVGARLEVDPVYQRDLVEVRRRLARLRTVEEAAEEYRPPEGLARRTCDYVFAHIPSSRVRAAGRPISSRAPGALGRPLAASPARRRLSPCGTSPAWVSRLRWIDAAVLAAIVLLVSAVIWPAILGSRFQARLAACTDNLRELGLALTSYSRNHDDTFPAVPAEGRLAAAGVYAPVLVSGGYLTDSRRVVCPESPEALGRDLQIPTVEQFQSLSDQEAARLRRQMGGSYGYCIGHLEHGRLVPTRNLGRTYFAVMADAPSDALADRQSLNHAGRGQNVLFEDGHVGFVTGSRSPGTTDDIFANDDHMVAPGIQPDDSVIAGSGTPPIIYVNYR